MWECQWGNAIRHDGYGGGSHKCQRRCGVFDETFTCQTGYGRTILASVLGPVFAAIGLAVWAVWHSCEFGGYNPTKLLIFWAIFLVEFGLTALFVVFEWISKNNVQSDFDRRLATLIAASVSLPLLIILRANNLGGSLLVKSERVWSSPAGRVWLAKEAFQTIVLCPLAYVGYPFGILSVTAFPFAAEIIFASVTAGPWGRKQKPSIRRSCAILLVQALYFGMPIISLLTDYGMFLFYGEGICGGAKYTPNQNLYNPYSLTVGLILCKMWVECNLCFILHGWDYSAVNIMERLPEILQFLLVYTFLAIRLVYIVLWFLGVFLWVALGMAQCQSERLLLIPAILSWVCWFLSSCVSLGCDWHASNLIFNHILGLSLDLKCEKAAEAEVERVMVWMGMIVCTHVEPQADPPPPQAPVDGKYRYPNSPEKPFACNVCGKGFGTQSALDDHSRSKHQSGSLTIDETLLFLKQKKKKEQEHTQQQPQAPMDGSELCDSPAARAHAGNEDVECGLPPGWRQKQVCMTPWRLFRARFA